MSSSVFAAECTNGSCGQRLKSSAPKTSSVTKNIVTMPIKVGKNVVPNIQPKRLFRLSR